MCGSIRHLCTSSYQKGKQDYMLEACQFLVTKATKFYERYASQGRWTRCVHCMEEARVASAAYRFHQDAHLRSVFTSRSQQRVHCASAAVSTVLSGKILCRSIEYVLTWEQYSSTLGGNPGSRHSSQFSGCACTSRRSWAMATFPQVANG